MCGVEALASMVKLETLRLFFCDSIEKLEISVHVAGRVPNLKLIGLLGHIERETYVDFVDAYIRLYPEKMITFEKLW
jgi:hypothetical protein